MKLLSPLVPERFVYPSAVHKKIQNNVKRKALLPVVSHGCETWSFRVREKHRLRVFEEDVWVQEGRGKVVSYGAEAWTLTKKEEQAVLIF